MSEENKVQGEVRPEYMQLPIDKILGLTKNESVEIDAALMFPGEQERPVRAPDGFKLRVTRVPGFLNIQIIGMYPDNEEMRRRYVAHEEEQKALLREEMSRKEAAMAKAAEEAIREKTDSLTEKKAT